MKIRVLILGALASIPQVFAAIYPESPRERVEEKIAQLDAIIEKLKCGNALSSKEKQLLILKESNNDLVQMENEAFLSINYRDKRIQKIKKLLSQSESFLNNKKSKFLECVSIKMHDRCWNAVFAQQLSPPIFLAEKDWDEQFFDDNEEILKNYLNDFKKIANFYLASLKSNDLKKILSLKKQFEENATILFKEKIPKNWERAEALANFFIFEICPIWDEIVISEIKLNLLTQSNLKELENSESYLFDYAKTVEFEKKREAFEK